jgi:hypothetical protein
MLRRVVVLVLALLVPLPGLAHTHAGYTSHDPSGIDRSPHFHLRSFYAWALDGQDRSSNADEESEDHDDDAVYVSASVVLGRGAEHSATGVADGPTQVIPCSLVLCCQPAAAAAPPMGSPPFWCSYLCPIYVRSRALLI